MDTHDTHEICCANCGCIWSSDDEPPCDCHDSVYDVAPDPPTN